MSIFFWTFEYAICVRSMTNLVIFDIWWVGRLVKRDVHLWHEVVLDIGWVVDNTCIYTMKG